MTKRSNPHGATIVRAAQRDVLVVDRRNPDRVSVIPDPSGQLGNLLRLCAARDSKEKNR